MSNHQLLSWVRSLQRSLGEPRPLVDTEPLRLLHEQRKYVEMASLIKRSLGLDFNLSVGLVNSGGPENAPAWVETPRHMPIYGSRAFRELRVITYFRKSFLSTAPFGTVVLAMSHELSHIVLDSIHHELREEERAVDLTAMFLGYRKLYLNYTENKTESFLGDPNTTLVAHYGYLSLSEIKYAVTLMRT